MKLATVSTTGTAFFKKPPTLLQKPGFLHFAFRICPSGETFSSRLCFPTLVLSSPPPLRVAAISWKRA
jgi:hypothetical protein